MSPAEVTTIAKLMDLMQGWPIWMVAFMAVISPWIAMVYLSRAADKRAADHEINAAKNMAVLQEIAKAGWKAYEDNVELLKETQSLTKRTQEVTAELVDIVHLNTQSMTTMFDAIKNNHFCPAVRKASGKD